MFSCSRGCCGDWDVRQCCELNCPGKNSKEQFLACPMRVSTFYFMMQNELQMNERLEEEGYLGIISMCIEAGLTEQDSTDVCNLWAKDNSIFVETIAAGRTAAERLDEDVKAMEVTGEFDGPECKI